MSRAITIPVVVSRVVFPKDAPSAVSSRPQFTVMLTDKGKCVGMIPFRPAEGARLSLTGEYEVWHGERNFRFFRVSQDTPRDPRALLDYVCKVGKGLGPKTADKVWAECGEGWQSKLDSLSPSVSLVLRRTLDALGANKERLDLAVWCVKSGFGPSVAEKAWSAWGASALSVLSANPYSACSLSGVGFKTVDALRDKFGVSEKDERRALAAVDFSVQSIMDSSGDSVLSRDALYAAVKELGVPRALAVRAVASLVGSGRVVFAGMDELTVSSVVRDEGDLARYVATSNSEDVPCAVEWPAGFSPDPSQVAAVSAVVSRRGLSVVNGGAGTGKTTIVKAIVAALERRGASVVLCAFAGKAAARLREATGSPASTIHSLLGWTGEGRGFSHGDLHGVSVVVDEASMVPSSLLCEITKRDPERLVLVGDQAQLQPVGVGSPFHDVIDLMPALVSTLGVCHRNREAVFAAALAVRNGECPRDAESRAERFAVVRFPDPAAVHAFICDAVAKGEIDFSQDLVLSPRNGDGEDPAPCTVKSVNESVQALVNPHSHGERFKLGDRVMCVKNFPLLNVWNGTVGEISRVNSDGVPFFAPDGGAEVMLREKEQRESIVPAYCLTVHKSQGSQYRDVYVVCLKRDQHALLDRSMLYTAVTRARRACYVLADDGVLRVVSSVRRRRTYLQKLLRGEC